MLKEFIKGNVKIVDSVANWEEALKIGAESLVRNGNIEERYIQAIIDNVYKNGPYIAIAELADFLGDDEKVEKLIKMILTKRVY